MGQGIKDDGLRKLHRTLNAVAALVMSREHCNWTYLTASRQLSERDPPAEDMSDC